LKEGRAESIRRKKKKGWREGKRKSKRSTGSREGSNEWGGTERKFDHKSGGCLGKPATKKLEAKRRREECRRGPRKVKG